MNLLADSPECASLHPRARPHAPDLAARRVLRRDGPARSRSAARLFTASASIHDLSPSQPTPLQHFVGCVWSVRRSACAPASRRRAHAHTLHCRRALAWPRPRRSAVATPARLTVSFASYSLQSSVDLCGCPGAACARFACFGWACGRGPAAAVAKRCGLRQRLRAAWRVRRRAPASGRACSLRAIHGEARQASGGRGRDGRAPVRRR